MISNFLPNTETQNPQPKIIEVPFTAVDCPKDSQSYQNTKTDKNIILLSNVDSYGKADGSFKSYNISLKRTGLNSEIACGYLFYRVSAGGKPVEQQYSDLYMIPRESKQFGGHILPQSDNTISNNEVNGKTEILLPLNNITYDGTIRQNIQQVNWVALLNVSNMVNFTVALNTNNQLGHIDSIKIAYKCWNPSTGQQTKDCNLELAK